MKFTLLPTTTKRRPCYGFPRFPCLRDCIFFFLHLGYPPGILPHRLGGTLFWFCLVGPRSGIGGNLGR